MKRSRAVLAALCATGLAMSAAGAAIAQDLRMALSSEPSAMDPHFHNLTPNNALTSHVFERLVHFDAKQKLIPGLATSWKAVDDKTWEFKLRTGVKWHDGSPFTADDVIFSMERAPNVENSPGSFALYVRGKTFAKVDDQTIRISTPEPYPLMPNDMATIAIISKNAATGAKTDDFNSGKAAIGTGQGFLQLGIGYDEAVAREALDHGDHAVHDETQRFGRGLRPLAAIQYDLGEPAREY